MTTQWLLRIGDLRVPVRPGGLSIGSDTYNDKICIGGPEARSSMVYIRERGEHLRLRPNGPCVVLLNGSRTAGSLDLRPRDRVVVGGLEFEVERINGSAAPPVLLIELIDQGDPEEGGELPCVRVDQWPFSIGDSDTDQLRLSGWTAGAVRLVLRDGRPSLITACAAVLDNEPAEVGAERPLSDALLLEIGPTMLRLFTPQEPAPFDSFVLHVRHLKLVWRREEDSGGYLVCSRCAAAGTEGELEELSVSLTECLMVMMQLLLERNGKLVMDWELESKLPDVRSPISKLFARLRQQLAKVGLDSPHLLERQRGRGVKLNLPPSVRWEIVR